MPLDHRLMKCNYHTHMYLCRHAEGDIVDYVKKAIELGFREIGISDHGPFQELRDRSVRMFPEEFPIYLKSLALAEEVYGKAIVIRRGLEIEFFPEHLDRYIDLHRQLDYLALGQHYVKVEGSPNGLKSVYGLNRPEDLAIYAATVVAAIESGQFKFVCHPDLMLYGYPSFDDHARAASEAIIRAAVRCDVALEINANGVRKGKRMIEGVWQYAYPRKDFWLLAKSLKARVIVSSDAHRPTELYDEAIELAYEFARSLGIVVVEALTF